MMGLPASPRPSGRQQFLPVTERQTGVPRCLGLKALFGGTRTRRAAANRRYRAGVHKASSGSVAGRGRTVSISAATQDKCRADRRAEKEGFFHFVVGLLFGSGPEARFPLASYQGTCQKASRDSPFSRRSLRGRPELDFTARTYASEPQCQSKKCTNM